MFYVIRVKGWPVLVWLERTPPAERYDVLATFDDVLMAVASFFEAVQLVRQRQTHCGPAPPRP
jgi:hypothetical protein